MIYINVCLFPICYQQNFLNKLGQGHKDCCSTGSSDHDWVRKGHPRESFTSKDEARFTTLSNTWLYEKKSICWFSCTLLWHNIALLHKRDEVCALCVCPYLGHTSGIKAENPLVAAGVDSCTMPAFLYSHARIQHTVWVVLTVGQLCTHKHLYAHTQTLFRWGWIYCVISRHVTPSPS